MTAISAETRFDAAYKAIMQVALAALMANGFRPDTNRHGHHMTVVQSLPKSIGLATDRMVVLDALRGDLPLIVSADRALGLQPSHITRASPPHHASA